ncbi:MAG: type II toxin-antitoxin system VapC family toxin [Deltaproteobacteria bacterium]|nr:type II toxin-antitoxin system VapC family toxin [Deltaproteobacteria bacterium]
MYLDTAVLVKLLVREPDSAHYVRIVEGQIVWSSQVVLTECFSALLRKERERQISVSYRRRAWAQVERDVTQHRLNLVTLTTEVLVRANGILGACHPAIALRSLDAIHLASAERSQSWPACSNDGRMRLAAARLGLPLASLPR